MIQRHANIELSNDVFRLLRDIFYEYNGVFYDDHSKFFLEGRLQKRLRTHQFQDFKDYYYFLKYDLKKEEELAYAIDLLTIHETYFFREEKQLRTFTEEVLPIVKDRNHYKKNLRIWSAGCSSGEEPYTLAMLIEENGSFKDWKVEIFANDISPRILQIARGGVYQEPSFRCANPYFINKYFKKENNAFHIMDKIKNYICFMCINLLDPHKVSFFGSMDIIFCRNVIIYYDQKAKIKVINLFHQKLNEQGFLFLGHSESLLNISTSFSMCHLKNDIIYQKG